MIAIATQTYYPEMGVRAFLALRTIQEASLLGYPIVMVDGDSCSEFRASAKKEGAVFLDQDKPGMGPGRRQSIREASNRGECVFWTEPEKHPILRLAPRVEHRLYQGADLVVPRRLSLDSYPRAQRLAEPLGNLGFGRATGHYFDAWFGPRLIGPRALPYFLDYDGEYGDNWDSIFIPVVRALASGLEVGEVEVNYVHPIEQTQAEESDSAFALKRVEQLNNLLPAIFKESRRLGLLR